MPAEHLLLTRLGCRRAAPLHRKGAELHHGFRSASFTRENELGCQQRQGEGERPGRERERGGMRAASGAGNGDLAVCVCNSCSRWRFGVRKSFGK
uniref:Uncharacterized protein n=1 Tax=Arundo donax TaxID=35708 RepID=A0A0A9E245_ARUDO